MIINEFNRPSSTSVKVNIYRSKTSSIVMANNEYGISLEKTPVTNVVKPSPKSITKPPKVPRPGHKGENLMSKFNDPKEGHINESINTDENQIKPFVLGNVVPAKEIFEVPTKEIPKQVQFKKPLGNFNLRER